MNKEIVPFDFAAVSAAAEQIAKSTIIPKNFRGDVGGVLIAMEYANRLNMPLLAIMQTMYIIYGKPAFESKFVIAAINASGKFESPLMFKYNESKTSCYAYSFHRGEVLNGVTVSLEMAKKEGWYDKEGSKWKTMPELMLMYRAASFWANMYAPDIKMGMTTIDEIRDSAESEPNVSVPAEKQPKEKKEVDPLELEQPKSELTSVADIMDLYKTADTAKKQKIASVMAQKGDWRSWDSENLKTLYKELEQL